MKFCIDVLGVHYTIDTLMTLLGALTFSFEKESNHEPTFMLLF